MTTIFYGAVPFDDDTKVGRDRDWSCPWRMPYECDHDEALDIAAGIDPDDDSFDARSQRRQIPVRFIEVRTPVARRFVLAIRDSIESVTTKPVRVSAPSCESARWPDTIMFWARRLGIPVERYGEPSWFVLDGDAS